jgi:hypothetical protein
MKTLEETFALTKLITVYCTSTAAKYLAIHVTVFEKMMSCRRTQDHLMLLFISKRNRGKN